MRAAQARGLDIDAFAGRLSFFFGIGMNFFLEVAKLRAARQLWSEIMTGLGAKDPRSKMLRTHCQTSGVSLTEQDPHNNIVRTTIEALAATLGGTQSLHTNSFDEAIALPTEFSSRIARNTQLILQHESRITDVVDPLGGSYYIEALTAQLVEGAKALIGEVEAAGGMTKAVQAGGPKLEIEKAAALRQARVDRGEDVIVGVNRYRLDSEDAIEVREIDNAKVRAGADRPARPSCKRTARRGQVPVDAVGAARISRPRTRAIFWKPPSRRRGRARRWAKSAWRWKMSSGAIRPSPASSPASMPAAMRAMRNIDAIAARIAEFKAARGRAPSIFIAKMGQDGHDRGAKVIASAFADLGFDVHLGELFETAPKSPPMSTPSRSMPSASPRSRPATRRWCPN